MNIGPMEGLLVLIIVILVFGASRLPRLARSLGQASTEFRAGRDDSRHSHAVVPSEESEFGEPKD